MPKCTCGNTIDKLPAWLDRVEVVFRCSKCPSGAAPPPVLPSAYAKDEDDLEQDLIGGDIDDSDGDEEDDADDESGD